MYQKIEINGLSNRFYIYVINKNLFFYNLIKKTVN